MRRSLPAGLGLIALALASARPAMALDPQSLCWRDYPIPAPAVRYEQAFASETLAPDRISVNGKTVTLGLTEKNLNDLLRMTSTRSEERRVGKERRSRSGSTQRERDEYRATRR